MSWITGLLDLFKTQGQGNQAGGGVSAGLGSNKQGAGGNMEGSGIGSTLKKNMGYNPDSQTIGESAMQSASETAKQAPIQQFADYAKKYDTGKESNIFQFAKDIKDKNYAGSLGYASQLAKGAQQGARPTPLIRLPQQQQRPMNRYADLYGRYRRR